MSERRPAARARTAHSARSEVQALFPDKRRVRSPSRNHIVPENVHAARMLCAVQAAVPTRCRDPAPWQDPIDALTLRAANAAARPRESHPCRAKFATARYPKPYKRWVASPDGPAGAEDLRNVRADRPTRARPDYRRAPATE